MNTTTSDADSQEELEEFVNYLANTLFFNYADLTVFALLLFEYLITLDREVQLAWGRKLTWSKAIFLSNRYLSILEYLLTLGPLLPSTSYFGQVYDNFYSRLSSYNLSNSCVLSTRLMQALQIVLYSVWAAFAGLRVYAISARSFVLTLIVMMLALIPAVTNVYVAAHTSLVLATVGCMGSLDLPVLTWNRWSVATRSCLLLSDVLVIMITWVKTWGTMRVARTLHVDMSFTSLILKEGILYFVIMASLNIVQIVFDVYLVGSYGFIVPFLNVMTPILISRFFLDLDDLMTQESPGGSHTSAPASRSLGQHSTMRFVVPSNTNSTHAQSVFVYGNRHNDHGVNDFGSSRSEKGYPVAATTR